MRGLSNKNSTNRSVSTCSFCRHPEHQVGKCPHIPIIWKSLCKGVVPLAYMKNIDANPVIGDASSYRNNHSYWRSPLSSFYSRGENWGDLFKQASRAHEKYERAQERAKKSSASKKQGKSKSDRKDNQTCGFCGDTGHTRRTCAPLSNLNANLAKANRNFRTWFYDNYVIQQGLSTGCIIEFEATIKLDYAKPSHQQKITTIVTEINWDTINLFSTFKTLQLDWRSFQQANIESGQDRLNNILRFVRSDVLLKIPFSKDKYPNIDLGWGYKDGESVGIPLPMGKSKDVFMSFEKQESIGYSAPPINNLRVVSRAPQILSDDWVNGYSDEMSVIFKKFNKEELDFLGIIEHIEEWANKSE